MYPVLLQKHEYSPIFLHNIKTGRNFLNSTMEFNTNIIFCKQIGFAISPTLIVMLIFNHVGKGNSQETTEIFYDCEKYCRMDCAYIPDSDPFHKEQCHAVHSHHSDCSCHFGGLAMGVFITLGVFVIIILMACVGRHCRKRRTVTNTRIVVVTQPVSREDLENNNYHYQSSQQNVYSIPMETKRTNYHPNSAREQEDETSVTVITSRACDPILDFEPASPNAPSRRIYFENSSSSSAAMAGRGNISRRVDSEDRIFAPPTF